MVDLRGQLGRDHGHGTLHSGRIRGVERPALGSIRADQEWVRLLSRRRRQRRLEARYMVQFAAMGAVYAREMMGRSESAVGLLSNGEEEGKGMSLSRRRRAG